MQNIDSTVPSGIHNLVLVDHRELFRDGYCQLISNLRDFSISGQLGDGSDCLRLSGDIHPDIVVSGAQLPGMSGIDLCLHLHALQPAPRVVLVGSQESRDWVTQAVQAGVCGLLMQRDKASELVAAIRAAGERRLYLSPIANALFAAFEQRTHLPVLTPRQREILQLYARGQSSKQIAYQLHLSIKTVATHREQILQRLGLRNTAELIRHAIREGLVEA